MSNNRYLAFFPNKSESGPSSAEPSSAEINKTRYNVLPGQNARFGGFGNEKLGLRSSGTFSDDDISVSDAEPSSSGSFSPVSQTPRMSSKEDLSKLMPIYLDMAKVSSAALPKKNLRTLKHTLSRRYDATGYVNERDAAKKNETNAKGANKGGYANDGPSSLTKDIKPTASGGYLESANQKSSWSDSESDSSSEEDNLPRFQINEEYTSSEQQKQCIAQLATSSAEMKLKAETLMNDNKLTPDQKLNKLASLLTDFKVGVEQVTRESDRIKTDLGNPRDWNAEYQKIIDSPSDTVEDKLKRYQAIASLTQDFEYTAQMYGQIIITEVFLKNKFRTIRPFAEVGGNAGGEKFIYNGILFKFAVDWKGIYGSDHAAMKAAKHELLGFMTIQGANIEGVCMPLMCLIDYLGFRLVAISLIPGISKTTLVYGSNDGGLSVKASSDACNKKMEQLGKKLNLAEHVGGRNMMQVQKISTPVDIEGHLLSDGKFYLLDPARLMPPTYPDESIKGCYLIRLFRPEFVNRYSKPLSSDACSTTFDQHDPNKSQHKANIKSATQHLIKSVVPRAAIWLDKHAEDLQLDIAEITEYLHASGVNLRYLPEVRRATGSGYLKVLLLVEMVARGIKNHLLFLLREAKKTLGTMAEQAFREMIANVCNMYMRTNPEYSNAWELLRKRLSHSFDDFHSEWEFQNDLMNPRVKQFLAVYQGVCPTVKWSEPLNVPMVAYVCTTCAIDQLCGVCVDSCHAGHKVERLNVSTGFMCACARSATCHSVKRKKAHGDEEWDHNADHPFAYLMQKLGVKALFRRVSQLTGIEFSRTGLDAVDRVGYFKISDVKGFSAKIKRLPVVAVTHAKLLALKAQNCNDSEEQLSLMKQSIALTEEALAIYPGSEQTFTFYNAICLTTANASPKEEADTLYFNVVKEYRVQKDKKRTEELLNEIQKRKLTVDRRVIDVAFDILMDRSISPITRQTLDFLKFHGKLIQTLALDGLPFIDDETLKFVADNCQCSTLSISFCDKLTDEGVSYVARIIGKNLRELVLDGNKLTDASLDAIAKGCPTLLNLSIANCEGFSDKAFKSLSKLPLSRLNMKYCPNNPKFEIPSLQILFLVKTNITLDNAKSILKKSPLLHTLDLSGCAQINENAAELLPILAKRKQSAIVALERVTFKLNEKIDKEVRQYIDTKVQISLLSETIPSEDLQRLKELNFTVLRRDMSVRSPQVTY